MVQYSDDLPLHYLTLNSLESYGRTHEAQNYQENRNVCDIQNLSSFVWWNNDIAKSQALYQGSCGTLRLKNVEQAILLNITTNWDFDACPVEANET